MTTPLIRDHPSSPAAAPRPSIGTSGARPPGTRPSNFAARLVEICTRDGADALAVYCCAKATNEDNYLLQKLFRAVFRTNNVDHCTRLCHAGSVVALQMALGSSAMSNTAAEVTQNDVFIVTGSNTTENHPIIALQMKAAVQKHGAKLIVVDPRRIETGRLRRPVAARKARHRTCRLFRHGACHPQRKTGSTRISSTRAPKISRIRRLDGKIHARICRSHLRRRPRSDRPGRAHVCQRQKRRHLLGPGHSRHSHGTQNALALIHLALLTGHIGRPGTGLNPLRGQNNVQGASDSGAMPWHYPGYQRVDDEAAARKFEQAWNIEAAD